MSAASCRGLPPENSFAYSASFGALATFAGVVATGIMRIGYVFNLVL